MGIFLTILLLVAYIGLAALAKSLPTKIKIAFILILSIGMAWLHFLIAPTQLNTVGFAASNREANYLACYLGYALSILGLLNTILVFKFQRLAVISLGILITLLPVLYFLSW